MDDIERIEKNGHLILVGAVSAGGYGDNKGTYAWEITVTSQTAVYNGSIAAERTRAGLVLPRAGSTYAEVKSDIFVMVRDQMGGDFGKHTIRHWDFEPNIVFGASSDYTAMPDEKDVDTLTKDVTAYQAWEKAEAAKHQA